jgi:hypothetical protein
VCNLKLGFRTLAVGGLFLLSLAGCKKDSQQQTPSHSTVTSSPNSVSTTLNQQQKECLAEARKALGINAQVLRCSELNTPGIQEVVAVIPAKYPPSSDTSLKIWKLVILRHEPKGWRTALTASRQIQNDAGYIGLEFIDDDFKFMGYQLRLSDERSDDHTVFAVNLIYIESADGGSDQIGTEIAWNPAVGRYQEVPLEGEGSEEFKPEIKNPPHCRGGVMIPSTPPQ